jgi:hypothetical protein
MRPLTTSTFLLFSLLVSAAVFGGDRFDQIKKNLSEAECVNLRFLSIIESDIFDLVDTAEGTAQLGADGRYAVSLRQDKYWCDLEKLYSYSEPNNQITIERVVPGKAFVEEVSFLTRLDELYESHTLELDQKYRLLRRDVVVSGVPDSLVVTINRDSLTIATIEYFDVNEEPNRIVLLKQETISACPDSAFVPIYPDSTEVIELF